MKTVEQALEWARGQLAAAGVTDSYREAQLLLAHALGLRTLDIVINRGQVIKAAKISRYKQIVEQRRRRMPLAYIVGKKSFLHWDFFVQEGVLIPRPETELLVETAVSALKHTWKGKPLLLADIGTGCGAIGLSLAALLPRARVHAVDISSLALTVAKKNAALLGIEQRVRFHQGDLLQPLTRWQGMFACITANLPYISNGEYACLEPELYFEPRDALVAGENGLALYRRLISNVRNYLVPGGLLYLEAGWLQGGAVVKLCNENHLSGAEILRDLAGHQRIIRVQKKE